MTSTFKWHTGDMDLKTFYKLTAEEKKEYINSIKEIPAPKRSNLEEHIVKFFQPDIIENKNFFKILD